MSGTATAVLGAAALPSLALRGTTGPAVVGAAGTPRPIDGPLRVMTLNLAHGRADGRHQLLTSNDAIRDNLDRVAALLRREQPDVVALQEADGPSAWSGGFDHVARVAMGAGFAGWARGEHVAGPRLRYGAALIAASRLPGARSLAFSPSPPTPTKGAVAARISVDGRDVDVVSVHLDFARQGARRAQLAELAAWLDAAGPAPRVVMGDMNMAWCDDLRDAADALGVVPYDPEGGEATFPTFDHRIDWILASPELEVVEHAVLGDVVSDHRAVTATLRWRDQ